MYELLTWWDRTPTAPAGKIILVIEPSTDRTLEIAKHIAASSSRIPVDVIANPTAGGKGFAVRAGLKASQHDVALFMDADGSVPMKFIKEFYKVISTGQADICIGSRRCRGSLITTHQPMRRELAGRLFNLVMKVQGFAKVSDTQCGFKAFSWSAAHTLAGLYHSNSWSFDVELLYLARIHHYRIKEMPVEWGDREGSKLSSLVGALPSLWETTRHCWRHRITRQK